MQCAESADGSEVAKLVVRLYAQTSDDAIKDKCLNHIDQMEFNGFYGIDQELNRVDR